MESSEEKRPSHVLWDSQRQAQVTTLPIGDAGIRVKIIEPYTKVGGRWFPTGEMSIRTEGKRP